MKMGLNNKNNDVNASDGRSIFSALYKSQLLGTISSD